MQTSRMKASKYVSMYYEKSIQTEHSVMVHKVITCVRFINWLNVFVSVVHNENDTLQFGVIRQK